jgi:hypothetical protein
MNFTYKQPYVTWKGPSTGSAIPSWSRPLINNNTNTNTGTSFAARPIKHWRKQLVPAANTGITRNASMGMPMDRPGGSVYLGATVDCSNCLVNLTDLIPTTKNTIFDNTKDASGNCVACNPETNIIKSGITLLNKNYYTDSKAYLQSRCQTYDQKLSTTPIPGNSYINPTTHQPIPPSDSPTGSQVYYTENCSKKCETINSVVRTIYKPNNQQYSQQGSVSSSSRLTRLKNNTITKNGNSFKTAWGQQGANAGRYQGTSDSDYFLKTKNQECVPQHRNGNRTTSCINENQLEEPAPQTQQFVYVGSWDRKLWAFNTIDGTTKWQSPATGGSIFSSPTLNSANTVVYVGSDDGILRAFNPSDGTLKWQTASTGGSIRSSPVLST